MKTILALWIFLVLVPFAFAESPVIKWGNGPHGLNKVEILGNLPCSSVSSPDLLNSIITKMKFDGGNACISEADTLPSRCDWGYNMSKDEILRPIPGKQVRLVVINSNHLAGSGAWDTVLVFDCLNGSMETIFNKDYLYGSKIDKKTDGELIITSGEWQSNDPMCCPSKEKREIYRWNSNKNTFILESETTSKFTSKEYNSK